MKLIAVHAGQRCRRITVARGARSSSFGQAIHNTHAIARVLVEAVHRHFGPFRASSLPQFFGISFSDLGLFLTTKGATMRESMRKPPRRAVHIVDDDANVRRSLWFMLETAGYAPRVFACADDLLDELDYLPAAPLLVDLFMPGIDGLQLLGLVRRRKPATPILMISGHTNVASAVRAMQGGALDFIEKPFELQRLLTAVDTAMATLDRSVDRDADVSDARRRLAALTRREQEVLACLVAGRSNKLIAFDLGLSIRTVEMHRARMMHRLGVRNMPEALRLAHLAGVTSAPLPKRSTTAPDQAASGAN
jgi:two-component system response regulator FixJ